MLTEVEKEVILMFASCNMKISHAAKCTYMHRNTFVYYLEKIKRKMALDPRNFYDLVELVKKAKN